MREPRTYNGTDDWIIEEVGVKLHTAGMNGGKAFDALVARNVPVTVEFDYAPGHPGNLSGRWEDAEEPIPDELNVTALRTTNAVFFDGDGSGVLSYSPGFDLLPLLPEVEIEAIEEELLKRTGE